MDSINAKYCIVNGDDFGASGGVNRGIVEAHERGVLTSASLMVNMPSTEEAARLSARYPNISIGLHVNFTNEGQAVIDIEDPVAAEMELTRQFDRFRELMGAPPTHVDSHHNVHRSTVLAPVFRRFSDSHGLLLREHSPVRYFSNFYGQWDGVSHPEHVSPDQLIRYLESEVGCGFTEVACHPGYVDSELDSIYAVEREVELATLCDPRVRRRIEALNIQLINYTEARERLTGMQPAESR